METGPLPRFVTCYCKRCSGHIEFDAELLDRWEARVVECPHCHGETIISVSAAERAAVSPVTTPKPPAIPKPASMILTTKKPKSVTEVFSIFFLIGFVGWTAICGMGALYGIFSMFQSPKAQEVLSSNDPVRESAGTIGFIIGMGMWFAIWLFGAVPTFLFWFIMRRK
jgi:hypothetical protein